MAIPTNTTSLENQKFVESTVTASQPGIVVVNPDGSNVGASVTVSADTEFPTAAATTDAVANPTTTIAKSFSHGFNGTTWDRLRTAVVAATSTLTGWLNTLPWAIYNATPTSRTEGQGGPLQADSSGNLKQAEAYAAQAEDNTNGVYAIQTKPLAVSTYSPSRFQNIGANATLNVKASTGNIFSLYCHNISGGNRFLQLHNTASTPGGGAVPVLSFFVPPGGVLEKGNDYFTLAGLNFATGIAFAFSTTEGTYTAATATDHFTQINYI